MFLDYSELLNALDSGASAKITIYNRRINKAAFERSVLLPDKDDGLDEYRHEFNQMLTARRHRHQQQHRAGNAAIYLTVSAGCGESRQPRRGPQLLCRGPAYGTDLEQHQLAQLFERFPRWQTN